jgi:hypothetical protein
MPALIGSAGCRRRAGKTECRAAAPTTTHHPVEAALQHLLHVAGEVRERAIGERKRCRVEHGDLLARNDEWCAVGVDGRTGQRAGCGVNGKREQPIAALKVDGGLPACGEIDCADHAPTDDVGQRDIAVANKIDATDVSAGVCGGGIAVEGYRIDGADTGAGIDDSGIACQRSRRKATDAGT